jgi:hypothetical protein
VRKSKGFESSGLDEVFTRMMKRKQEAIAAGWIKDGVVQTKAIIESLPKPEKKSEGNK